MPSMVHTPQFETTEIDTFAQKAETLREAIRPGAALEASEFFPLKTHHILTAQKSSKLDWILLIILIGEQQDVCAFTGINLSIRVPH